MSTLKRIFLSISILIILLLSECDIDNRITDNRINCAGAICTEEFRSIVVTLKHSSDSTAYILTVYKVIRIYDKLDITPNDDNLTDNNGYYPITNDLKLELFKFKNVEVEFSGYLNNALVIQSRFIITGDCCHISLVEGDTKFYI